MECLNHNSNKYNIRNCNSKIYLKLMSQCLIACKEKTEKISLETISMESFKVPVEMKMHQLLLECFLMNQPSITSNCLLIKITLSTRFTRLMLSLCIVRPLHNKLSNELNFEKTLYCSSFL